MLKFHDEMKLILLTQGYFAKVDDHWYEFLNQWNWYYHKGYACRAIYINGKQSKIFMHRLINNTPEGFETDHEDGDKLNNQEFNLRTGTHQQNMMNSKSRKNTSSKYKGVYWNKNDEKWFAQIRVNKKKKHLGSFDDEIEAAQVYDQAALKYQGEYARLNFPQEVYA